MSPIRDVVVIVGSLRRASLSRRAAIALAEMAPGHLRLEIVEIGHLPHYTEDADDEGAPPQSWVSFRQRILAADAILFVTPEYNRSVPGVLKNAIDVGSRPGGQSVWDQKPAAVMSISPGALGGFGANHHLRQSLVFLNMPTLQQPEAYVGRAAGMFEDGTGLADKRARSFFETFITAFASWIEAVTVDRAESRVSPSSDATARVELAPLLT